MVDVKTRDTLRFRFMFGGLPEDTKPGKNIQENFTVTYTVPYDSTFSISSLRSSVEHEHEANLKLAHRTKNEHKRNERSGVARLSVDSVRNWFNDADVSEFDSAVLDAVATNTTTCISSVRTACMLSITPQHSSSALT